MAKIASRLSVSCIAVAVFACVCGPAPAQQGAKEKALYLRLLHSSTWVVVLKPARPGTVSWGEGSGWVVNAQRRFIVTNYHVVGEDRHVQVFFPYYVNNQALTARKPYVNLIAAGGGNTGTVIAVDRSRDLAVIQLSSAPAWIKGLPIAPESVTPGERVYNLGNPGGDTGLWKFSASTVLNVRKRDLKSKTDTAEMRIQAIMVETNDRATRKGQSGSLVVNPRGELVGVVQSISQTQPQTTMAIERSEVLEFLHTHGIPALLAGRPHR
jgi:S1-C subfamily serine protease